MTRSIISIFFIAAIQLLSLPAHGDFENFVTRSADKLMDGDEELRFISTNLPDILQIIDNTPFEATNKLRLPNDYEIQDAVSTVKQMGGQVLRTFSITAKSGPSEFHLFDVSTNPVTQNENAFRVLDKLLETCNRENIRLYLPLIAYSNSNRGDPSTYGTEFWTVGSASNLTFKNMVSQLINRTNSYSGIQYKNDKAILAWESGNELVMGLDATKRAWLHDLANYVKSIDSNHLFMDGRNKPDDVYGLYEEFFTDDNIDIVSYHTYLNLPAFNTPAKTLQAMREYTLGKRPLVVGEIAMYTTEAALETLLKEQIDNGTSGSNWWAHRFRNRDGGFYRHSDNGSNFEDLNWPGFPDVAYYLSDIPKARNLQDILADHAYQIQGQTRPPLPLPDPPVLLPILDIGHISWQSATGTQSNDIQRATSPDGPWTTIRADFHDALTTYDRLFCDTTAETGSTYYYRIIGKNTSGLSEPSNIQGPIKVTSNWLVDDFFDLSQALQSDNVAIKKGYNHYNYANDLAVLVRTGTQSPSSITYQVSGNINSISAYLHRSASDPTISLSTDGSIYTQLTTTPKVYGNRKLFTATLDPASAYRYLRIQLNTADTTEAIGRLEIEYNGGAPAQNAPFAISYSGSPLDPSTFQYQVLMKAIRGVDYTIESSPDLSADSWQPIPFSTMPDAPPSESTLAGNNTITTLYIETTEQSPFIRAKRTN